MREPVAIVTPSYRNDFALACDLCASVDRHFNGDYEHVLVVPERDRRMFDPLGGPRRRVVSKASLLGKSGMWQLPLPQRMGLPPLIPVRAIKEQWWLPGQGRISGWLAQQLIKLSADELTSHETLLFVDSDALLVRPASYEQLLSNGLLRLHRTPMPSRLSDHLAWHDIALKVLGLPPDTPPVNYVGQLITWKRSNLQALHARIEAVAGRPWIQALASAGRFAEYILYGVFCEHVLGLEASGHSAEPSPLTHSIWVAPDEMIAGDFARGLFAHHVALHIQSTLELPVEQRRSFVAEVKKAAGLTPSAEPT